jgi:Protein of unknown function (DUF3016)
MRRIVSTIVLLAAAASAHAAGSVQVSFVQPEKFADVRDRAHRAADHLAVLQRHLEEVGAPYVAQGQTLKIEVLDVDLAGEVNVSVRAHDIRVLRGRADWPRLQLRYTLEAAGGAARSGAATVSDMAYLQRMAPLHATEPLPYERRMLEEWFKAEFGAASR